MINAFVYQHDGNTNSLFFYAEASGIIFYAESFQTRDGRAERAPKERFACIQKRNRGRDV